jgi:hypothetical protein
MEKADFRKGKGIISHVLDLACMAFAISAIMDAYLWLVTGYMMPSWTMAEISFMYIVLMQILKREMFERRGPKQAP